MKTYNKSKKQKKRSNIRGGGSGTIKNKKIYNAKKNTVRRKVEKNLRVSKRHENYRKKVYFGGVFGRNKTTYDMMIDMQNWLRDTYFPPQGLRRTKSKTPKKMDEHFLAFLEKFYDNNFPSKKDVLKPEFARTYLHKYSIISKYVNFDNKEFLFSYDGNETPLVTKEHRINLLRLFDKWVSSEARPEINAELDTLISEFNTRWQHTSEIVPRSMPEGGQLDTQLLPRSAQQIKTLCTCKLVEPALQVGSEEVSERIIIEDGRVRGHGIDNESASIEPEPSLKEPNVSTGSGSGDDVSRIVQPTTLANLSSTDLPPVIQTIIPSLDTSNISSFPGVGGTSTSVEGVVQPIRLGGKVFSSLPQSRATEVGSVAALSSSLPNVPAPSLPIQRQPQSPAISSPAGAPLANAGVDSLLPPPNLFSLASPTQSEVQQQSPAISSPAGGVAVSSSSGSTQSSNASLPPVSQSQSLNTPAVVGSGVSPQSLQQQSATGFVAGNVPERPILNSSLQLQSPATAYDSKIDFPISQSVSPGAAVSRKKSPVPLNVRDNSSRLGNVGEMVRNIESSPQQTGLETPMIRRTALTPQQQQQVSFSPQRFPEPQRFQNLQEGQLPNISTDVYPNITSQTLASNTGPAGGGGGVVGKRAVIRPSPPPSPRMGREVASPVSGDRYGIGIKGKTNDDGNLVITGFADGIVIDPTNPNSLQPDDIITHIDNNNVEQWGGLERFKNALGGLQNTKVLLTVRRKDENSGGYNQYKTITIQVPRRIKLAN